MSGLGLLAGSSPPPGPEREWNSLCLDKKKPFGKTHPDSKVEKCLRISEINYSLLALGPKVPGKLGAN